MKSFKFSLGIIVIVAAALLYSEPARAGFLDKLNAATQKLNAKTQQMQQGGNQPYERNPNNPVTGDAPDDVINLEDHYKGGSCEGHRTATCMDYNELVDHCLDPLRGYRAKLLADRIDYKLKNEKF